MENSEVLYALAIIDDEYASKSEVAIALEVLRRAGERTLSELLQRTIKARGW